MLPRLLRRLDAVLTLDLPEDDPAGGTVRHLPTCGAVCAEGGVEKEVATTSCSALSDIDNEAGFGCWRRRKMEAMVAWTRLRLKM